MEEEGPWQHAENKEIMKQSGMKFLSRLNSEDLRRALSRSWSLSWPMTLIMFFEFLIGLADVYIAGKVGKDVQAAYGFVIQLYLIFIVIANAVTVGTVSVVSRLFTSGESQELYRTIFTSLTTAAVIGVVFVFGGLLLAAPILNLLTLPAELKTLVFAFTRIYAIGLPFHYLLINSNGVLRSCHQIKKSLMTMSLVCILNIALNFIYVFKTPLGFRGIALATASSVFIGSLINWIWVQKLMRPKTHFAWGAVKSVLRIGWPIGVLQALWQLASMVLFLILSALPEKRVETLAALTAGLRIESVIYLPAFALNMANAVIIGNFLGERKEQEAFRGGIVTAAIGVGMVVMMVMAVILNARWIASALSPDERVIQECVRYIYVSMVSEPFMAWGVILGGGLSGAGDTKSVMTRVALSLWLVRIPLSYLFVVVLGFGAVWVWWSMNFSQFLQSFLITKRYLNGKWLQPI
ncbi:MAG: MATE family efflux transporter [Thermodesulfobacteriota bacterium]